MQHASDITRSGKLQSRSAESKMTSSEHPCVCPYCQNQFPPESIKGNYLARKCPICSSTINAAQYDKMAPAILERRRSTRMELEKLAADMRITNHAVNFTKPEETYILSELQQRKSVISSKMKSVNTELSDINSQLKRIAVNRYYISEWYFRTRIDLDHQAATERLNIKPHYSPNGTWCFKCKSTKEAGFAAELYVSELLFQKASDPLSPLYRAQVFPNIYIPRKREDKKTSLWIQIDCLMLTRFGVFILEIKRHSRHFVIPNESSYIPILSSKAPNASLEKPSKLYGLSHKQLRELGFSDKESAVIDQNELHAECFKSLCPMFDLDNIYRQTVYVKPKSFNSNSDGFINGICIDYAYYEDPHFLNTIESQCAALPALYAQQQIDDIAIRIISPNCDLDHRRETLHKLITTPRKKRKPNKKAKMQTTRNCR